MTTPQSSRRRASLLSALCLAFGIAAAPAHADDPIKIGLSGPFSGGSAPMGNSMRLGIRMAVDEINTYVGGVLGRKIELVERDDAASPDKGVEIAKELIEKEKVAVTVGIVNTGVGLKTIDLYQAAKVPLVVAVSTGSELTRRFAPPNAPHNFVFRMSPRTGVSNAFLARHLVEGRGLRQIGILADDTGYGEAEMGDLVKALATHGVKPVRVERFGIGDRDMRTQLDAVRSAGAQALVMFGIGPELAAIAKGKAEMGWSVPTFASWTVSMRNFLDQAGPAGDGVMTVQSFIPGSENSRHRQFVSEFANRYGKDAMESAMSAAQGYDAMRVLFNAMSTAGSLEGDKIRNALEHLDRGVEGVVTTYIRPFTPEDHDAITENMLVLGVVRQGRIEYAFKEDARRSFAIRRKGQ
ncbi:ABC transporter substrate-binding protein [Denitromonas iodatirespirans]|uniref:ABC transporter substrate-binding protein n=1 Tax=Denitromonas iodatirespirans TaxID=2795389 RepID=A0A944H752_DENI1|nr:ABC transporter substrate-binding protein [Denitromonas iodatirespirans]MBT0960834.1 ABC transporter substrate-binding protein [Denitromonas iodatirespirans]